MINSHNLLFKFFCLLIVATFMFTFLNAADRRFVGAWYGNLSPATNLGLQIPVVITFHADGIVSLERSDRLAVQGGIPNLMTLTAGSWEKTGERSLRAKVIAFVSSDLTGLPVSILVGYWEGELSEGQKELTIISSPEFFPCTATPGVPPGYSCEDPLAGGGTFMPDIALVLSRIDP